MLYLNLKADEKGFSYFILAVALALQVFVSIYGFGFSEDAYVHAEIARVVANNPIYPASYEPLAPVQFTYPPLFHYFSLVPYFFTHDFLLAVNIVGYSAVVIFPLAMFFVGSLFGLRVAAFSALFSVIISSFARVYFFGEFPQVLATVLLSFSFYFYVKRRYYVSGTFLGLVSLSHAFIGPFSYVMALFLLAIDFVKKNFSAFKLLVPAVALSSFWLLRYSLIVLNAFHSEWNNVVNYSAYPGVISLAIFSEYLINAVNPVLLLLSFVGMFFVIKAILAKGFSAPKHYFGLLFLFLTTFSFTIYHFPPFQLKMLDLLTIPVVLGAAIAVDRSLSLVLNQKRSFLIAAAVLFALFIAASFMLGPIRTINDYKAQKFHIPEEVKQAALFLEGYDKNLSRIIVVDEYRRYGKSELIVSRLSGKLPLDAVISDLESYSPEYQQRLSDRQKIISFFNSDSANSGNAKMEAAASTAALLQKYGIRYVFARNCVLGEAIFRDAAVSVCQV